MKHLSFSIFVIAYLLFFAVSCSSPAVVPTEASETNAPTATPKATSTEAEELIATPTTAIEELEIVEYLTWTDPLGDYRVEMLVRNPYDHPVWVTSSWTRILDASDQILVSGEIYIGDGSVMGGLGHILPGETVPAVSCLTCSASGSETLQGLGDAWADTLTIGFVLEPATPIAYSTEFEASGTLGIVGYGTYEISGTVKYLGDQPLNSAFVRILFYDQEHKYIGWGEASVFGTYHSDTNEFDKIEPGAQMPFTAFSFPVSSKADELLDYEITVIGEVAED